MNFFNQNIINIIIKNKYFYLGICINKDKRIIENQESISKIIINKKLIENLPFKKKNKEFKLKIKNLENY